MVLAEPLPESTLRSSFTLKEAVQLNSWQVVSVFPQRAVTRFSPGNWARLAVSREKLSKLFCGGGPVVSVFAGAQVQTLFGSLAAKLT